MAISFDEFSRMIVGSVMIDMLGNEWPIVAKAKGTDFPTFCVRRVGYSEEWIKFVPVRGGIVGQDNVPILALRDESAFIKTSITA